jgi:hypothetical protein
MNEKSSNEIRFLAILGVLGRILLLGTACTALPAGGESGSIALVQFSSEEYGIKGVVPVACEQGAPGQFDCSSLRSGQSPVFLILQVQPMTLAELIPLLVTDLNLSTVPSSTGTLRGAGLTWELYNFEASLPDLGPETLRLDLALAEHGSAEYNSVVYVVALLTRPDDYDPHRALYETVLRHVAYALAPLE